jgi:hypothetical protein
MVLFGVLELFAAIFGEARHELADGRLIRLGPGR